MKRGGLSYQPNPWLEIHYMCCKWLATFVCLLGLTFCILPPSGKKGCLPYQPIHLICWTWHHLCCMLVCDWSFRLFRFASLWCGRRCLPFQPIWTYGFNITCVMSLLVIGYFGSSVSPPSDLKPASHMNPFVWTEFTSHVLYASLWLVSLAFHLLVPLMREMLAIEHLIYEILLNIRVFEISSKCVEVSAA